MTKNVEKNYGGYYLNVELIVVYMTGVKHMNCLEVRRKLRRGYM